MSEAGKQYLYDKLHALIIYASKEHDLEYGEVVQVLEMQKLQAFHDYMESKKAEVEEVGDGE